MERVGITKLRSEISDLVSRVQYQGERVIVERQGKPAAALISAADLEWLEELEDRLDDLDADRAEAEAAGKPNIPWEKIKAELGL